MPSTRLSGSERHAASNGRADGRRSNEKEISHGRVSCSSRGFHFSKIWSVNRWRQIALSNSKNAVSFSSARTTKRPRISGHRYQRQWLLRFLKASASMPVPNTGDKDCPSVGQERHFTRGDIIDRSDEADRT